VIDGFITRDVQVDGLPVNVFGPLGLPNPLTYRVTDTAGNLGLAVRQVQLVDTTAPNITLLGSAAVAVVFETQYVDAGAQAYDSYQGNITYLIVVDNPVNTSALPGTRFNVTFNVRDDSNNSAQTVLREVTIVPVESSASAAPIAAMAVAPIVFVIVLIFLAAVLLLRRKRQRLKQVDSRASGLFDSSVGIENPLYSTAMAAGATGRRGSRASIGFNNSLYTSNGKPSFATNPLYQTKSSSAYKRAVEDDSLYSQPCMHDEFGTLELDNFDAWSGESVVETGLYEPLPGVPSSEPNDGHDGDSDDHYQQIRLAHSETGENFGFYDQDPASSGANHSEYLTVSPDQDAPQNPNGYMTVAPQNPNGYMTVAPNKDDVYITPVIPNGLSRAEDDNSEGAKPSESQSRASLVSGYIMVEPSA